MNKPYSSIVTIIEFFCIIISVFHYMCSTVAAEENNGVKSAVSYSADDENALTIHFETIYGDYLTQLDLLLSDMESMSHLDRIVISDSHLRDLSDSDKLKYIRILRTRLDYADAVPLLISMLNDDNIHIANKADRTLLLYVHALFNYGDDVKAPSVIITEAIDKDRIDEWHTWYKDIENVTPTMHNDLPERIRTYTDDISHKRHVNLVNDSEMPMELRIESSKWLRDRGYIDGIQIILPELVEFHSIFNKNLLTKKQYIRNILYSADVEHVKKHLIEYVLKAQDDRLLMYAENFIVNMAEYFSSEEIKAALTDAAEPSTISSLLTALMIRGSIYDVPYMLSYAETSSIEVKIEIIENLQTMALTNRWPIKHQLMDYIEIDEAINNPDQVEKRLQEWDKWWDETKQKLILDIKTINKSTKEPAENVSIVIWDNKKDSLYWTASTDEGGRYSIIHIPEGEYLIKAGGPGERKSYGPKDTIVVKVDGYTYLEFEVEEVK